MRQCSPVTDTALKTDRVEIAHATSHPILRINSKRFQRSPYIDKWAKDDTLFGIYADRLYPVSLGGNAIDQYWKLRRGVLLYDVPERPIDIKGPDAGRLLEQALCRRVDNLKTWRARYAIGCTAEGGIIMDGVVIRLADDHQGSRTPLLNNRDELNQAILGAAMSGLNLQRIVIVEFCDVSGPDKLYRKYSAFRVGDRVIPRHLIFSEFWLQKTPDIVDEEKLKEERAYLDQIPHQKKMRKIFDNAKINYGRIDYGVVEDEIQVWEINTHPMIMGRPSFAIAERHPVQEEVLPQLLDAFRSIDTRRRWWQRTKTPGSLDPRA